MSVGRLRPRARGARITAFSYAGDGTTVATDAGFTAIDGAAYDTCPYDSDGFTGTRHAGDPLASDNYTGDGSLTIPAGMGGLYLIEGLAEPGGIVQGDGTQATFRLAPRITRDGSGGDVNPSTWGAFASAVGSAALAASEPYPGFSMVVVLEAGDVIYQALQANVNDLPSASPDVTVWAHLTLTYLGRT